PHPLAPHLGTRDLDAAALADDALVADALVLAAVALPVLGGTEDALAEEAVLLRLQRPVVDGLRLGDLAARPGPDLLRRGESDADGVEVVDVDHSVAPVVRGDGCGWVARIYDPSFPSASTYSASCSSADSLVWPPSP